MEIRAEVSQSHSEFNIRYSSLMRRTLQFSVYDTEEMHMPKYAPMLHAYTQTSCAVPGEAACEDKDRVWGNWSRQPVGVSLSWELIKKVTVV